jgi:hypothetical protein
MTDNKSILNEIKDNASELPYEDRMHVLHILRQHLHINKIIEHADGCRVNLDILDNDIIQKLHYIIKSRMNISQQHEI